MAAWAFPWIKPKQPATPGKPPKVKPPKTKPPKKGARS